jgi:hypothetical protein
VLTDDTFDEYNIFLKFYILIFYLFLKKYNKILVIIRYILKNFDYNLNLPAEALVDFA